MSISSTSSSTSTTPGSAFNFDGVASGLNTSSIIASMMKLEQGPLNGLKAQQTASQTRDAAYQGLETQVNTFQAALHTLLIPSNVNAKAVGSTTPTVATASANSAAANGSYALNVDHLATATTIASGTIDAGTGTWVRAPIGAGVQDGTEGGPPTTLSRAGFATTPTAGSFTINGVSVSISDPTTQSLNDVVNAINAAGTGVQASVTTDTNGHKNFISLHATNGQPVQLGSGGDTSNFLTAAHLVATGSAGDLTSSVPLGTPNTSAVLTSVNFGTPLTAATGSFQINGKAINWDTSKDTVSSILSKINASGAGVTAVYDSTHDAVNLTSTATGGAALSLTSDTGGMLAALHLNGGMAQQTIGKTAQFQINGGAWQYSNSNTVTSSLPGVSLALTGNGVTTLSVTQDTSTTITNVTSFVTAFNTLVDAIDKNTAYDATNKAPSVLTGDSGITGFESQIRGMLVNTASGLAGHYNTLASIGISTGALGSAIGTTNHLVLDTTKLTAALTTDPNSVVNIIGGPAAATLNPDSQGNTGPGAWISGISGVPSASMHGQYKVTVDSFGNISSVFTPSGSSAYGAVSGTIAANGNNSTLIAGLNITVGALPTSGTRTDTITFGSGGVLGRLSDFLSTQLGKGGVFDAEHTSANQEQTMLTNQITDANATLALRQQTLQAQFTAMETALAQLNSQGGSLMSSLGLTSANNASSSSSA